MLDFEEFKLTRLLSARSLYGEKAMKLPERTNEVAGIYANECVSLASELGIPSINLWSKMQETEGWQRKFLRFVLCLATRVHFLFFGKGLHLKKVIQLTCLH